ncbi:MAG TPA: KamA family radical SAM protein [Chlamydiales bacterium]|nr:KamA family radical SAM protein [Chlamydiales bacterium]
MTSPTPSWRKIQRGNFIKIEPLLEFLELDQECRRKIWITPRFPLNLPRRLAEKIKKNTLDDPILRQFLPLLDETIQTPGFLPDPVQDIKFQKSQKILHKYKSRALILTTNGCAMNCRFCFRQNFPYETKRVGFEEELSYLSKNPTVTEVILSGGDPLSLSDKILLSFFQSLEQIPHIQRIRFHSRFPIGIPERIDSSFLKVLESSTKQLYFIIHCNHPSELDADVLASLKKISLLGVPILNQSVLLKGVNDNGEVLLKLSNILLNHGIMFYYLHELDPVTGTAHFALPSMKGLECVRYLQEHISGFGVPHLVREVPGCPSKTFISV